MSSAIVHWELLPEVVKWEVHSAHLDRIQEQLFAKGVNTSHVFLLMFTKNDKSFGST